MSIMKKGLAVFSIIISMFVFGLFLAPSKSEASFWDNVSIALGFGYGGGNYGYGNYGYNNYGGYGYSDCYSYDCYGYSDYGYGYQDYGYGYQDYGCSYGCQSMTTSYGGYYGYDMPIAPRYGVYNTGYNRYSNYYNPYTYSYPNCMTYPSCY